MAAVLLAAVVVLKPPVLAANGFDERFDGELVIGLAGDVFADERRMMQSMCRIAASGPGIEREFFGERIAAVTENVIPHAVIFCTRGFRTNAGCVVEQL